MKVVDSEIPEISVPASSKSRQLSSLCHLTRT